MNKVRWYWWVIGSLFAVIAFLAWFLIESGMWAILVLVILGFFGIKP